jgi:hypothetical protein
MTLRLPFAHSFASLRDPGGAWAADGFSFAVVGAMLTHAANRLARMQGGEL